MRMRDKIIVKIFNAALTSLISGVVVLFITILTYGQCECKDEVISANIITLPTANVASEVSVEDALLKRRSIRRYADEPLNVNEVSQLLWAAQGVTNSRGFRTSPSAGALYPLETYVVIGNVSQLPSGVYKYKPNRHGLVKMVKGDKRAALSRAALGQGAINNAPVTVIFFAVYRRTTSKYGQRGIRYVFMETGHAAQNICLQAVSLGLGTVTIGAFHDEKVKEIVGAMPNEEPLYIIPVGRLMKR